MAIAFEIKGSLAMFRKPYTTTSTVSFPVPTPTAIAGLLAAIIGIDNGSSIASASAAYWNQMKGTRIAFQRLNENKYFSATINFWNTKDAQKSPHVQIKHQFVRNPHYRIFVDGKLVKPLQEALIRGEYRFTPCLGVAYALANVEFLGEMASFSSAPTEELEVRSVLPQTEQSENAIDYLKTRGLMKDTLPFRMAPNRQILETISLFYPVSPEHGIFLKPWSGIEVFEFNGETIAWLPEW